MRRFGLIFFLAGLFCGIFLGVVVGIEYRYSLRDKTVERRIQALNNQLKKIDCRLTTTEYIEIYANGRRDQRELDKKLMFSECLRKIQDRKCITLYSKERKIMKDENSAGKKKRKYKKRTTKKKTVKTSSSENVENSAIDFPDNKESELSTSAQLEPDDVSAPDDFSSDVSEETTAAKEKTRVKDESLDPGVEFEYEVGSRYWVTRHTHICETLVSPGTVYEVVESIPDSAPVSGGGDFEPSYLKLVRGSGPLYFKLIGRHTALERM